MAIRPDLRSYATLSNERIVLGNGTVRVETNDLAEQAAEILRLIAVRESLALGDEHLAVRREYDAQSEVKTADDLRVLLVDHLHVLEARSAESSAQSGGACGAVWSRLRIREIHQLCRGEVRIQCDVEQTALSRRSDRWNSHERCRDSALAVDDAKRARLLSDDDASVWQEGESPRTVKPRRDRLDANSPVDRRRIRRLHGRPRRPLCVTSGARRKQQQARPPGE